MAVDARAVDALTASAGLTVAAVPSEPDTTLLHGDAARGGDSALVPPIHYSATFAAADAADFADMATRERHPRFYTRYGNPLHERVAALVARIEGAGTGLCFASGMGAISALMLSLLQAGDHVVAQRSHYLGTAKHLGELLPRLGIEATLVDQTDSAAFAAALRPNTRLVHIETPANPTLALTDIAAVAAAARARGIPVSVDNTFASPVNQNPIALGADLVVHSATKYLGGHHDLTAGVIVGGEALCARIWRTAIALGATLSPMDAWLLLRGLRTLGVRVRRQNETALEVAGFLEAHPAVERVHYPLLASHPQHELASRQMRGGGALIAVAVRGDYARTARFVASLGLFAQAVSLGGVESLAAHAAAMWAGAMDDDDLRAAGIAPNLVRLSIGLESAADLCTDLERALVA